MVKPYYVSGNTAEGFVDLLETNLQGIEETIELNGESLQMDTEILQQLIQNNKDKTTVEVLMSPISERYLEGVIFRDKKLAILSDRKPLFTNQAYGYFAKGLRIHDDLEKIYIQEMDFEKADQVADDLIRQLLADIPKEKRKPRIYNRLLGTNTMEGVVNVVPQLIRNLQNVYHIKGRAGTGKSTFMKRVANACLDHGLDLEIYHCSFDPNSIDMVLIPALSTCLFDSTDPHAFEPEDDTREKIIDLYEEAVTPGTDEKYEREITELTQHYKSYMKKGVQVIQAEGSKFVKKDSGKTYSQTEVDEMVKQLQTKIDERN